MHRLFAITLVIFVLGACSDQSKPEKLMLQGKTMGTSYHITIVVPPNTSVSKQKLQLQIDNALVDINQKMSTYITDSELSLFNQYQKTDWFPVSEELANIVHTSKQLSEFTNGSFDITSARLVNLWGFGPDVKNDVPTQKQINNDLQLIGSQLIDSHFSPPAIIKHKQLINIDLSAIAKGYAVDVISGLLSDQSFKNSLVEIGGEIKASGLNISNKPWQIAIEKPAVERNQIPAQIVNISNQAVATSGNYRNYFKKSGKHYSHTINPTTGKPIEHNLASVTVIDKSTMRADALATALLVMGEDKAQQFAEIHKIPVFFIIQSDDGLTVWNNLDSFILH